MKVAKTFSLVLAFALIVASCGLGTNAAPALAVEESLSRGSAASLDFQDEVVYFVFVDRFHDGDASNNSVGNAALHDSTAWADFRGATNAGSANWKKYRGGDLEGLIEKLPYLKQLGVTTIWVTPLANNIDQLCSSTDAGYHGYWAKDFFNIDEHLGSWDKFDELITTMHSSDYGMKLVLDFAPNHSNPDDTGEYGALYKTTYDAAGNPSTVYLTNKAQDKAAGGNYYNHNGGVSDWSDPYQNKYHNLFNLTDFNQDKPDAWNYLIDSLALWMGKGVDGVRVDAVKHFNKSFTTDMVSQMSQRTGRDSFFFGEWMDAGVWQQEYNDGKYNYNHASIDYANTSGSSVLDFGYQKLFVNVLKDGASMNELAKYLRDRQTGWTYPLDQVVFLDNHDAPRLLSQLVTAGQDASFAKRRVDLGLVVTMTIPGVPCVYYGTEQYAYSHIAQSYQDNGVWKTKYSDDPYNRETMPAWDTDTRAFGIIQKLSALKRSNKALQDGSYAEKWANDNDVLVYERKSGNQVVVVAVNKGQASAVRTLAVPNLSLPNGSYADVLGGDSVTVSGGTGTFVLSQNECIVLAYPNEATYPVSGRVTRNGQGLQGVTLTCGTKSTTTDASGNYTLMLANGGPQAIVPSMGTRTFTPASRSVTVSGAAITGQDFSTGGFISVYPSMFLRGSMNGWRNDCPMNLVADYSWEVDSPVSLTAGTAYSYKYDVYGNWTLNFGKDGVQGGTNISFTPSANGIYVFSFNDQTKAYSVRPKSVEPPDPPVLLSVGDASNTSLKLTWSAAAGATSYSVYRSPSQTGTYALIASLLSGLDYTNGGLSPDTTYWYRVTASNAAGESDPSNTMSGKTTNTTIVERRLTIIFKSGGNTESPSFPGDANNWSLSADARYGLAPGSATSIVRDGAVTSTTLVRGNDASKLELKVVTNASWNNQWSFGNWTKVGPITLLDNNRQIAVACAANNEVILTVDVSTLTLTAVVKQ